MAKVATDTIRGWASIATNLIPPGFFVAMSYRESGYDAANTTNESNGQVSKGLCQVNDSEATSAGYPGANLYDGQTNINVIAALMVNNLSALSGKYSFDLSTPPDDVWYYLAASHNAGLSKAESWIDEQNGVLDWAQTKANHPTFVTIAKGYADYIGDAAVADTGILGNLSGALSSVTNGDTTTGDDLSTSEPTSSGGFDTTTLIAILIIGAAAATMWGVK